MHATVKTRVTAALAAVALTAGAGIATATLASASGNPHGKPPKTHAKLESTTLSIRNKAIAHAKHHADAISGVLAADDKGVAGETVVLEARSGKMPGWHPVMAAVTNASGSATFMVTVTTKTQFKLVFAGDSHLRASHSNVVTVKVAK